MIPDGIGSVVVFLILIAPGLLFDWLEDRRRPTVRESAFREAGRTVLASLGFGTVAAMVLGLMAWALPELLLSPAEFVAADASRLIDERPEEVVVALLVQTVLACGLAVGFQALLAHKSDTALEGVSLWFKAVRAAPKGTVAYAQVRLTTGATWSGVVEAYSADVDAGGRELLLSKPILAARRGEKLKALGPQWERVVLRGDEIEWIAFKYDRPPSPG